MKYQFASDFISAIFQMFNQQKILYLVLRHYEELPESNASKDVDLLVLPDQFNQAQDLITACSNRLGYSTVWKNDLDYLSGYVFAKVKDKEQIFSIKIDLFCGLKWRGMEYIRGDLILKQRVKFRQLYIPQQGHEALISVIYSLLYAKGIKEKYIQQIKNNLEQDKHAFSFLAKKIYPANVIKPLISFFFDNQHVNILALRRSIIWRVIINHIRSNKLTFLFPVVFSWYVEVFRRRRFGLMLNFFVRNQEGTLSSLDHKKAKEIQDFFCMLGVCGDTKEGSVFRLLKQNMILGGVNLMRHQKRYHSKTVDISFCSKDGMVSVWKKIFLKLDEKWRNG